MPPAPPDSRPLSFYLDENVTERLILPLTALGYAVTSANRLGHKGLHDGFQLLFAATSGRVVITNNVDDFKLLHRSWLEWSAAWQVTTIARHNGILLLYPSRGLDASDVATSIDRLVKINSVLENRLFAWSIKTDWYEVF